MADQLNRYRGMLCLVIALALQKCWLEIMTVGSLLSFPAMALERHGVFFLAEGLTMILLACAAPRVRGIAEHRFAYGAAAAMLVASMALAVLVGSGGSAATALTVVEAVAGGVAASALYLFIVSSLCRLSPVLAVLVYLVGTILSFYLIVLCYALPTEIVFAAAWILPVPLGVTAFKGRELLGKSEAPATPVLGEVPHAAWKVLVLMAMLGFTFAFKESAMGNALFSSGSMSALGSHGVEVAFFLGIVFLGDRFRYAQIVRVALPVAAVLFLFVAPDTDATKMISDVAGAGFYSLVTIYALFTLFVLCSRYAYAPLRLFGLVLGAHNLCTMLGNVASQGLGAVAEGGSLHYYLPLAVALAAVGCMLFLVVDGDAFSLWPRSLAAAGGKPADPAEALRSSCAAVARERGLTPREEEIVLLIAEGLSFPDIQERLCVAVGTMKTHRRNIYAKCGVHSKEALIDLINHA